MHLSTSRSRFDALTRRYRSSLPLVSFGLQHYTPAHILTTRSCRTVSSKIALLTRSSPLASRKSIHPLLSRCVITKSLYTSISVRHVTTFKLGSALQTHLDRVVWAGWRCTLLYTTHDTDISPRIMTARMLS